jgi:hypothetical protein
VAGNFAARPGNLAGNFAARPGNLAGNLAARPGNFAGQSGSLAARSGILAGQRGDLAGRAGDLAGRAGRAGRAGDLAGRAGNLAGEHANWYGHHEWDNYFNHGGWGGGWGGSGWGGSGWGGWGWGGYWPWDIGWGLGWGYPYDPGYYYPDVGDYYPYAPASFGDYYSSYAPTGYGDYYDSYAPIDYGNNYNPYLSTDYGSNYNPYAPTDYGYTGLLAAPAGADVRPLPGPSGLAATTPDDQLGATPAVQYYSEARAAFVEGDYRDALRLAGHAGVEAPQNPKVHELASLALFALGNYTAAAGEAHAAMALGPIADWKDLYGYYNDANKYTTQLRALEKAAGDPKSAAEHFLLGYHYLMTGARENAKDEFAHVVKLSPSDKLAAHCLQQLQSNAKPVPAQMASKPKGTSL